MTLLSYQTNSVCIELYNQLINRCQKLWSTQSEGSAENETTAYLFIGVANEAIFEELVHTQMSVAMRIKVQEIFRKLSTHPGPICENCWNLIADSSYKIPQNQLVGSQILKDDRF